MVTAQALPSLVPPTAGSSSAGSVKAESPPRLFILARGLCPAAFIFGLLDMAHLPLFLFLLTF